jgi:hypothetical protein
MLQLRRTSNYCHDYHLFIAICNADMGILFKVKKIIEYYLVQY